LREDPVADGHGAWIVSCHPGRLFTRNQAITAMVLAERLAAGYGDDDPFLVGWHEEVGLVTDGLIRITTALAVVLWPSSPRSSPISTPTNWCARTVSPG
jgi:hypothetical protein